MGRCTFKYYSNMESLIIQGVLFSVYYWYEMIGKQDVRVFTARQRSCGKVLFHRCLSVILFEGGETSNSSWDRSHGRVPPRHQT